MNYLKPAQVALVPKLKAYRGENLLNFILHDCDNIEQKYLRKPRSQNIEHVHTGTQISRFECFLGYSSFKIIRVKQQNP